MKMTRFAALVLGLSVAACAGGDEAEEAAPVEETTPAPAPVPAPDTMVHDSTMIMDSTATTTH